MTSNYLQIARNVLNRMNTETPCEKSELSEKSSAEHPSSVADAECEKSEKSEIRSVDDLSTPGDADQPVVEKLQQFNSACPVRQSQSDQKTVLVPDHPLANFQWVDQGIDELQHKKPECRSTRAWRHRWGGWYCEECWPCTDTVMCVETAKDFRLKQASKVETAEVAKNEPNTVK